MGKVMGDPSDPSEPVTDPADNDPIGDGLEAVARDDDEDEVDDDGDPTSFSNRVDPDRAESRVSIWILGTAPLAAVDSNPTTTPIGGTVDGVAGGDSCSVLTTPSSNFLLRTFTVIWSFRLSLARVSSLMAEILES